MKTAPTPTPAQARALALLRAAGGGLDYQRELYGFALPGADKAGRVQMTTARALIAAGLVTVTRTKQVGRRLEPDRLELTECV